MHIKCNCIFALVTVDEFTFQCTRTICATLSLFRTLYETIGRCGNKLLKYLRTPWQHEENRDKIIIMRPCAIIRHEPTKISDRARHGPFIVYAMMIERRYTMIRYMIPKAFDNDVRFVYSIYACPYSYYNIVTDRARPLVYSVPYTMCTKPDRNNFQSLGNIFFEKRPSVDAAHCRPRISIIVRRGSLCKIRNIRRPAPVRFPTPMV